MANAEHLAILRQGVEVWNEWMKAHPDVLADLSGADLSGANLTVANLDGADLRGADLIRANLHGANLIRANLDGPYLYKANLRGGLFYQADLSGADLSRTNLFEAHLSGADLRGAHLRGARLRETNLSGAHLRGANLSQAVLDRTVFATIDLSTVIGLDTMQHQGPSVIGIDTLYMSHGTIPLAFLRGCGVPDTLIEYLPSLLGAMEPIQFYSCFISYSAKDEAFAKRLHERMRAEHLRVWFAPENIKGGRKVHEQVEEAIRVYDKLLVILSPHSRQSKWVSAELRRARTAELAQNRRKLFPIRLMKVEALRDWECIDPATGQDIATEVRDYHIPDFSQWKDHDAFEDAFARLLRDLKAVDEPPAPASPPVHTLAPRASGQPAPAYDHSVVDDPAAIIALKRRRLGLLVQQQTRKGDNTPPEVIMEIEDLRREIAALTGG